MRGPKPQEKCRMRRPGIRWEGHSMWVERYEPRWHSQLIELSKMTFGEGYFSNPWLQVQNPGSLMYIAREGDEDIIGFTHGMLLEKGTLREYLGPGVTDYPPEILDADKKGNLAVIDVVAVAPGQRRKGVGFSLLQALHDGLIGVGADKLLVTFRRGPGASNVHGLMQSLGFDLWHKLPSYWHEACVRGDFKCADRKGGECVCEAMVFRKSVY